MKIELIQSYAAEQGIALNDPQYEGVTNNG